MSSIMSNEGFEKLDNVFINNNGDAPTTLVGNLDALNGIDPEKSFRLNEDNIEKAHQILSGGELSTDDHETDRINTNFPSWDRHIYSNMNEILFLANFCTTVPELQRERRTIPEKEFKNFHVTTFVEGKTQLEDINLVSIESVRDGVKDQHEEYIGDDDPRDLPKEKRQTAELLEMRSEHYTRLLDDGYIWFILDGQTRVWFYKTCYSDDSTEIITLPEGIESGLTKCSSDGSISNFIVAGNSFSGMEREDAHALRDKLKVHINLLVTDDPQVASRVFRTLNSGVQVYVSLTEMNDSKAIGWTNQLDRYALHPNRELTEEYAEYTTKFGFDEFIERFYTSNNGSGLFSREANGIRAYYTIMAVYLFGNRMNCTHAEGRYGDALFYEDGVKGWNGVKLIHSTPYAQLTDEDFNTMLQILRGMSLGLRGSTNAKGKRVAFSMAVKVNGVYCAEGILEKCSLERVVVDDWKSIYEEFYPWNDHAREDSHYLKVTAEHIKQYGITQKIGEVLELLGKTHEDGNGYWKWGKDQSQTGKMKLRKSFINDNFINPNWDRWIKKGYIS